MIRSSYFTLGHARFNLVFFQIQLFITDSSFQAARNLFCSYFSDLIRDSRYSRIFYLILKSII